VARGVLWESFVKQDIPPWFVALVLVVTGGTTAWAMMVLKRGANETVALPENVTRMLSPGFAVAEEALENGMQVARAPAIRLGSARPHGDRGPCSACHNVLDPQGNMVSAIDVGGLAALAEPQTNATQVAWQPQGNLGVLVARAPTILLGSRRPHGDRGPCTPCHTVLDAGGNSVQALDIGGIAVQPNAGLPIALPIGAVANPVAAPVGPNELEWLGLDLRAATNRPPPPPTPGVAVTAVGDRGANAGVLRGDVVVAVDGMPTPDTTAFLNATNNGAKRGARLEVMRNQRIALNIGEPPQPAPQAQQMQQLQQLQQLQQMQMLQAMQQQPIQQQPIQPMVAAAAPVAWPVAQPPPQSWPQAQPATQFAMTRFPDNPAAVQPNVAAGAPGAPVAF
jgi:hypothetical protein